MQGPQTIRNNRINLALWLVPRKTNNFPDRGGRDPLTAITPENIKLPLKTDTATQNDTFVDGSVVKCRRRQSVSETITKKT